MQHAWRMVVGGVAGLARHLQDAVAARERLADARAMPEISGIAGKSEFVHALAPASEEKGEAGKAGRREGVPLAADVSARTISLCASSILNALLPEGFASASAASAARRYAA